MGRFAQTIDSFPARRWPPSIVVTGVNGGYDINVRQLAADGVRVVGRVAGASGNHVAFEANANQMLDEADEAYAQFVSAAREFAAKGIQEELAEEQPGDRPGALGAVSEISLLDLAKESIGTIIWATGYTYDFGWMSVPVLDSGGHPVQQRGVTQVTGLYFLGLHWMHTIKSGLFSYFRLQWPGCVRSSLPPAALASLLAVLPGDRNSDPDWVRVQSLPLRTAQP